MERCIIFITQGTSYFFGRMILELGSSCTDIFYDVNACTNMAGVRNIAIVGVLIIFLGGIIPLVVDVVTSLQRKKAMSRIKKQQRVFIQTE